MTTLENPRRSILQDWVTELPLREQGTLLAAIRGCDLAPKFPRESPERLLTAAIRGHVLVPADEREMAFKGSFMSHYIPEPGNDFQPSALGHYPLHYVTHAMHASEVIGFRHPETVVRQKFQAIYRAFVHSLHLNPEDVIQMTDRLSEDRIAKNTVLS